MHTTHPGNQSPPLNLLALTAVPHAAHEQGAAPMCSTLQALGTPGLVAPAQLTVGEAGHEGILQSALTIHCCTGHCVQGWCAFGVTCRFNHPELVPSGGAMGLQATSVFVGPAATPTAVLPTAATSGGIAYAAPQAIPGQRGAPTVYYVPITSTAAGPTATTAMPAGSYMGMAAPNATLGGYTMVPGAAGMTLPTTSIYTSTAGTAAAASGLGGMYGQLPAQLPVGQLPLNFGGMGMGRGGFTSNQLMGMGQASGGPMVAAGSSTEQLLRAMQGLRLHQAAQQQQQQQGLPAGRHNGPADGNSLQQ